MLHYCAFSLVRFLFVAGFVRLAVVLVESPVSASFCLSEISMRLFVFNSKPCGFTGLEVGLP